MGLYYDKETTNLNERMDALSCTALALGRALQGIGSNPTMIASSLELCAQLTNVVKRLTWLEKANDPNYEPFDPTSAKAKIKKPT